MLKLIYTEMGCHLEPVSLSLQDWLQHRIRFALSLGEPIWVDSSRGSILLPRSATTDPRLAALSLDPCDQDWVELSLWGQWLTADADGEYGVLAVELEPSLEEALLQIWRETQMLSYIPLWD